MRQSAPYLINQNSSGEPLTRIDPDQKLYQESWLQELLRKHPDILPTGEIEPVFSPLVPIGRETPTRAGYIDNLFISWQGYPVLVETKLWRNPEAKREVLTQAIDYAAAMSEWTFRDIDHLTLKYTTQYERMSLGLVDWIEHHQQLETDRIYFEETVSKNLRLGRFLILIVGDRIRSSVVDLLGYINKFPHLALNAALVELQCYQFKVEQEWPLLVIPTILNKTEIVERSIVQVNVTLDGSYTVKAVQEKAPKGEKTRSPITEDEFWNRVKDQAPDCLPTIQQIVEHYRQKDEVQLRMRESSVAFHLYAPDSGQIISLFFIRVDGVIECWHSTIAEQFGKAGLDQNLVKQFVQDLSPILRKKTKSLSINYPANLVDASRFIGVVDRFIDNVLTAESKLDS